MRLPFIRSENNKKLLAFLKKLCTPFLIIAIIPIIPVIMLVISILALLYGLIFIAVIAIKEYRFKKTMEGKGRYLKWTTLQPRLFQGEGSLIVEQGQKIGHRIWWTPDKICQIKTPPTLSEEDLELYYFKSIPDDPFEFWCFQTYIHSNHGSANLVEHHLKFPPGFIKKEFLSDIFPKLDIIMIPRLREIPLESPSQNPQ